ncbi:Pycsar system effector family protein [Phenylobacterium sp.]|jgi:hypothetical protein|uniref:Pycsar system effector family protein n=1 Tax=Phenylobacterium sp. TaxID=1871053 RepID=UPI00120DB9DC|nr:Pycsar system effector family protein [Phenylobacterium sp.]THD71262.1 MAG: hypothetical protein E8A12_01850 [Phenylobacterium sp.]
MADGEQKLEAALAVATTPRVFSPDAVQLLRNTQAIQYQLSQMADQKASMLLAITFVIFSLTLGQARGMIAPSPPVLILGGFAFLAAVLAVFAVLPQVKTSVAPGAEANILFFGAFHRMEEQAYIDALIDRLTDSETVFQAFARDIYQNGRVLAGKKYRLLGYAYRVLLLGLFCSGSAFVAPMIAHGLGPR